MYSVNPGFFRTNPPTPDEQKLCDTQILFRPCPQTPEEGSAGIVFAALNPGMKFAKIGSLIDYETVQDPTGAGMWIQRGQSCVVRPTPEWGLANTDMWIKIVEAAILSGH